MAYDENLVDRIRQSLREKGVNFTEKKMMSGLTFMIHDKMCVGIVKSELMARVGPEYYHEALNKNGIRKMDFTGKPMKGYVFAAPSAIDLDIELDFWINHCFNFNAVLTAKS